MVTIQRIRKLDKVSQQMIETIIEDYEDYRMEVNRLLKEAGGAGRAESYQEVAKQLSQSDRKLAILEQLYNENIQEGVRK